MADRPDESQGDAQWRTAGDRIQTLLDATATNGAAARDRAEQLVREVVELYGTGLSRIVKLLDDPAGPDVLDRLATDDLVASLLLVHGLHPHGLRRRVSDALERVRPYLGSHGGDVHLLEIVGEFPDYTVQLAFSGSCRSCPSSAATLELAVEDAIRAAAPEVSSIEVVTAQPDSATAVIPADSLMGRMHAHGSGAAAWHQVPEFAGLAPGEVGGFVVAATAVLACRVGDQLYAYRDHCAVCDESLAGAALHRGIDAQPVLRCPHCRSHFDVVHAGAGLDGDAGCHLTPMPLLIRDGVLSIAVPTDAVGAPA